MIEAHKERKGSGFSPRAIIPFIESNIENAPNITPDIPKEIVLNLVKINGEKATKVYEKVNLLGKGGFA